MTRNHRPVRDQGRPSPDQQRWCCDRVCV